MLGVHNGLDKKYEKFAKDLMETCVQMYSQMPTGLSPELVYFNQGPPSSDDIIVKVWNLLSYGFCFVLGPRDSSPSLVQLSFVFFFF